MIRSLTAAFLLLLLQQHGVCDYSRVVTLSPNITEDLEDFPVLIRVTDPSIFSKAMPHGEDVSFLDQSKRAIPFEVVSWDRKRSESEIWVRVPKLRSSTSTKIHFQYGSRDVAENAGFRGHRADEVWDGYDLVLHGGGSGNHRQSSAGASSGVCNGNVKTVNGMSGEAFAFDGKDSFVQLMDLNHVDDWITPVKKIGEFTMRSPQGMANDGTRIYFASHNDPKPADIIQVSIPEAVHVGTFWGVGPLHSAGGDYWGKNRTIVFSTGGNANKAKLREITITGKPIQEWNLSKVGHGKGALCAWKSANRWLLLTSSNSRFIISEVELGKNGVYRLIDQWKAPASLGIPQGMDYFDRHVYYYTDGGVSSRNRSPALITKLRLDPARGEVQYVDQYAFLIDNHEAEGLTICKDGTVYAGAATSGRGEIYRVGGGHIDDFVSTFKDFTVSLWFKQTSRGSTKYPTLIAKGSSTNNLNAFVLHTQEFGAKTLRVKFGMTAPAWTGLVSKPTDKDAWHHAVGIYDHRHGFAFYLDGVHVGTRPHTVQHTIVDRRVPATIGADIESNRRVHLFPGQIDEIRISNSATSLTRLHAEYQNMVGYNGMVQIGPEQADQ